MTKQNREFNFHNNAIALLIRAAEQSGLLKQIADALHHSNNDPGGGCLACGVLEELTNGFSEHCGLPGYDFFGEGFCIPPISDEDADPYMRIPPEAAGNDDQPRRGR